MKGKLSSVFTQFKRMWSMKRVFSHCRSPAADGEQGENEEEEEENAAEEEEEEDDEGNQAPEDIVVSEEDE